VSFGTVSPTARVEYKQTSRSAYDQSMHYTDLGAATGYIFSQPSAHYGTTIGAIGVRVRSAAGLAAELEYGISGGTGSLFAQTFRAAVRLPF
jgi:hypothetical protein